LEQIFVLFAMNTLEQFVDHLLVEKGITADPAVMDEYRADLMTRVGERLNAEMVALMPAEKVAELNDLLDADPEPEVLREFFMTYVPQYQDVFARTLADFRTSYLS
jgi:hypothetical protein